MDRRIEALHEKDREAVREWTLHRRYVDEVAPGTMRLYLQKLHRASIELDDVPILEAGERLRKWCDEKTRGHKNPWHYKSTFRLFLEHHKKTCEWTIPPKRGRTTKKRRAKQQKNRTFSIVPSEVFDAATKRAGHPMHRALLYLLWDTGMRPGELLSMRWDGVERDAGGNFFLQLPEDEDAYFALKTGARRVVLVESTAALREWMNHHPTKSGPLFPGERGLVMSSARLRDLVAECCPGHTPKDFRHTAATRATLDGWNEAQMRRYFGWEPASKMPSYYAEFSANDANKMRLKQAGLLLDDAESKVLPVACPRCNVKNVRENTYCFECGAPLRKDLVAHAFDAGQVLAEATGTEARLAALLKREDLLDALERLAGRVSA